MKTGAMRCAILQMKANLLVIYKNINIFTQKTLHPSFISKKKKFAFSIANAKKIFSHKTPETAPSFQKNFVLSIAEAFRNFYFHFLPRRRRSAIFQLNTNLLVIYEDINNFKRLYNPASFEKKVVTIHCKPFRKHPLFSTFSLFLTVGETCNSSNKYWLPYNLAKKYCYTRHY